MSSIANPRINCLFSCDFSDVVIGQVLSFFDTTLVVGNLAQQVNRVYAKTLSINTAGPTDLDLTNILDPGGNAMNWTKLVAFFLRNNSVVAGEDLTLGGGANPIFAAWPVSAHAKGGHLEYYNPENGLTVDGTHKTFRIAAAAGAAVSATLVMFGRQ